MKKYLHVFKLSFLCFFLLSSFQEVKAQGTNRVDVGKSYANLSKLSTGGSFNPGDTIEVRVTIAVIRQSGSTTTIDNVQVFDQIPANTTFIPGSIRVATNEGITYKGPFTDNQDSDQGSLTGSDILINLGTNATGTNGGRIRSSSRPSFFGSHCIMMACYKVRIDPSVSYGDSIELGGRIRYRMTSPSDGWTTVNFPNYKILLFPYSGYCPNGSDLSAASDENGTFGSGTAVNRAAPLEFATTYIKQNISTGQPQDYNYAIIKNSSADSWTNPNSPMPEGTSDHRVFGFWDIGGDHTNATNSAFGNPPPAASQRSGYFVLINASYNTNVAYQETLTNLCPNTYYEFSAWYRNVCPRCSCDSTGRGSSSSGYIPGPGNDSSGVKPNLNFEIDGMAYYTTGDIKYDRGEPWKKYGFTFLTKANQTTANFVIRNNSPGGGGNDWAIDDIKVSHCGPSLDMNYNPEVLGCKEGPFPVTLRDTIRFVYNSYVHYKWQISNIGGTVWSDLTGPGTSGVGTPVLVNGLYQYVATLPTFWATYADSGIYYRLTVATTAANLDDEDCAYNNDSKTLVRVITCGEILEADFVRFNGTLIQKNAQLTWTANAEQNLLYYEIEKSSDGLQYRAVGRVNAKNISSASYHFSDPDPIFSDHYYRLKMVNASQLYKYSPVVLLSPEKSFVVVGIENPFQQSIQIQLTAPDAGEINIYVVNDKGQQVKKHTQLLKQGLQKITLQQMDKYPAGIYYIRMEFKKKIITRKIMHLP